MADFFDNGESWLVVRTLINSLADTLKVAETDEAITAGDVTSIPVVQIAQTFAVSGDVVVLIDATTGTAHTLTLAADAIATNNALTITSYTFATDIGTGSKIYLPGLAFANNVFNLRYPV